VRVHDLNAEECFMKNRNGSRMSFRLAPAMVLAMATGAIALTSGCSAAENAIAASQGCDEFAGGSASVASLSIDGNTKAFVEASADFVGLVGGMETSVFHACVGIATDLGASPADWTSKTTLDDQTTAACNDAQTRINAILAEDAGATVACTVGVTGGGCTVQADAEAKCEGQCTGSTSCTPPDVTVSCDPGDLSVVCGASCAVNAVCEGTVDVAATCQGTCSADCTGECDVTATQPTVHCEGSCAGSCTGQCDGSPASGTTCSGDCSGRCNGNCVYMGPKTSAHCEGTCKGTCTGDCKLDANASVMCGVNVRCRGGCSVTGTAPQCEGKVKPAKCTTDMNCQASCQAHAELQATCTPPIATVECDGSASTDIQKLIATLQTNLPILVQVIQTQGPLAVSAGAQVASTATAFASTLGSVTGKALACAGTAISKTADASASLNVSVSVSVMVSGSCGGPTS
jgi:hypothetical protein